MGRLHHTRTSLRHSAYPVALHPEADGSTPAPATSDGDRDAACTARPPLYPCATQPPPPPPGPAFAHPPGLVIQTNNRLTDDYSRKIHCYISQSEDGDAAPADHMSPPALPSFEALSAARGIPFWRPPPVLQREPHYNHLGTPAPQHDQHQLAPDDPAARRATASFADKTPASAPASKATAGVASSLSPALLAISNSHYRQQQAPRSSIPAIRSLLSPPPPTQPLPSSCMSSSAAQACRVGCVTTHADAARSADGSCTSAPASAPASDSGPDAGCNDDCSDAAAAAMEVRGCHSLRLPPIPTHAHLSPIPDDGDCVTAGGSSEPMSIASLVDGSGCSARPQPVSLPGFSSLAPLSPTADRHSLARAAPRPLAGERKRLHSEESAAAALHKMARTAGMAHATPARRTAALPSAAIQEYPLCRSNQVVITCYHASVAQKSYGGEKRFLCPPPAVLMHGEGNTARIAHHSPMLISVITDADTAGNPGTMCLLNSDGGSGPLKEKGSTAALADGANGNSSSSGSSPGEPQCSARPSSSSHAPLECQTSFNERNVALFKSLHVTGMQKAKSFRLRLDLLAPSGPSQQAYGQPTTMPWQAFDVYASLTSDPVAIISKPSKKTAKARNQSSCIREGSLISLFNRINSQTFRTKHLNVHHSTSRLFAQSHNWSPLEVELVSPGAGGRAGSAAGQQKSPDARRGPLYYGSEIVLVEPRCSYRSPPMVIHKVERGRLVDNASSPVSQMQKVALQLKPAAGGCAPRYLKADVGHYSPVSSDAGSAAHFDDPDGSPELTFEPLDDTRASRARPRESLADAAGTAIDDAFCWTIVNISRFTHAFTLPTGPSPAAICASPVPQVTQASLASSGGAIELLMRSFDGARMVLLLDGLPLKTDSQAAAGPRRQRQQPGLGDAGAGSAADQEERYVAQLPAGARPGTLSIRRSDGMLYHTKWAVRQPTASAAFEVVACNLDI